MTQLRHWLCTAAIVLMPISTPIKVLVGAAKMPSPKLGVGHETTRVHHTSRRCGGYVAARGACAAAAEAGGRLASRRGWQLHKEPRVRFPERFKRGWLCRGPERDDRIPACGWPI